MQAQMPTKSVSVSRTDAVAYVLSIWFGCGLVPYAPGTAGSLGALPIYLLLRPRGLSYVAVAFAVVTLAGLWASHRTSQRLGQKDPQIVCIDEVAGVLLTLLAVPDDWRGIVFGFVAFRIADRLKPWPASAAERALGGGWGIMLDDLFAAGWAIAIVLCARAFGVLS
jgi:phosphatidylglycerophosphatase A